MLVSFCYLNYRFFCYISWSFGSFIYFLFSDLQSFGRSYLFIISLILWKCATSTRTCCSSTQCFVPALEAHHFPCIHFPTLHEKSSSALAPAICHYLVHVTVLYFKAGWTSFTVCGKLRRLVKVQKVWSYIITNLHGYSNCLFCKCSSWWNFHYR